MVGTRTADSHRPCEEEDTRDTVDILDREGIPPCAEAFRKVLPHSHGAEADIPEEESLLPLGEIHHDIREAEVEEDNRTEAVDLPAYTAAFVRPDGHHRVVAGGVKGVVNGGAAAVDPVAVVVAADALPPDAVEELPVSPILRRVVLALVLYRTHLS